jgi:hypothetical protein
MRARCAQRDIIVDDVNNCGRGCPFCSHPEVSAQPRAQVHGRDQSQAQPVDRVRFARAAKGRIAWGRSNVIGMARATITERDHLTDEAPCAHRLLSPARKARDRPHESQHKHEHNRYCPNGGERNATAAPLGDHFPKAGNESGLGVWAIGLLRRGSSVTLRRRGLVGKRSTVQKIRAPGRGFYQVPQQRLPRGHNPKGGVGVRREHDRSPHSKRSVRGAVVSWRLLWLRWTWQSSRTHHRPLSRSRGSPTRHGQR